ncbi:hypothetical protein [Nonomuraea sp. SYSU D8015]|uniref:hypothetical protein n=1 Tax=Nonomuraea sp. SYSU D8015 TaxID=2593644 RepID=UPI001CB6E997|nr:hypothetical protein [Nonomuraea sp. SYSU D8015]
MNRVHMPLPPFDPTAGTVVLSPEKNEPGYWAGCAGVLGDGDRYWLTYRQRRPRGAEAERGWRCAVAVSDDGIGFTDVWAVHKDELGSSSMERFCLTPAGDGGFRLFISYVDPADNRWRIDALTAKDPSAFDLATRRPVLTAASTGTEGVKDPYVMSVGPVTYLFASFAAALSGPAPEAHATGDIYNVGATTHPTGLATSLDGESFTWHGTVLPVGAGWNRYQTRLNSVVHVEGGYVGFYDGSASHEENYEERCGIAVSADLFTWHRLSDDGPWVTAPHGTGSVRYVEALIVDGEWRLYYEMTRADGAHELRLIRVPARRSGTGPRP